MCNKYIYYDANVNYNHLAIQCDANFNYNNLTIQYDANEL